MEPALILTLGVVLGVFVLIAFVAVLLVARKLPDKKREDTSRGKTVEDVPPPPEDVTPEVVEPKPTTPAPKPKTAPAETKPAPAPEPEAQASVSDEALAEAVLEAEQEEADGIQVREPAPVEPKPKGPSRLGQGLLKTRGLIAERLSLLTRRDRLGDAEWDEVEEALIRADVGVKATAKVVDALRDRKIAPSALHEELKSELASILNKGTTELRTSGQEGQGPSVWLVTGVNGVGKTTTIAKLALDLRRQGKTVVLAAADTFRAAAIDQLGTWADRVGVHMVSHAPGADPGAVVFDAIQHAKARGIDVVIVDTAGRLHTKSNLMEELKKVGRIAEREAGGIAEVLLVLDATVGQNGIAQARTFGDAMGVTGVILTKLDGTARGGIVVAIQEELGIPVKAIGVGETLDDLEPFVPEEFVTALLQTG